MLIRIPADFYNPFFGLVQKDAMTNKAATIKAFRQLEMILPGDTPKQVEFYYEAYKDMIGLFGKPYTTPVFDFSQEEFFEKLYEYGEKISKMPEFKQARGAKHFIYINRTNFGLYTILHDLKATVRTDTYSPEIALPSK